MGADLSLPEREAVRIPVQWDATANGGFTTSDKPYNPIVDGEPYGYEQVNVADQLPDPDSLLSRISRLVDARQLCTEITDGSVTLRLDACEYAWLRGDRRGERVPLGTP